MMKCGETEQWRENEDQDGKEVQNTCPSLAQRVGLDQYFAVARPRRLVSPHIQGMERR